MFCIRWCAWWRVLFTVHMTVEEEPLLDEEYHHGSDTAVDLWYILNFKLSLSRLARPRLETVAITWCRIVELIRLAPVTANIRYCWTTLARCAARLRLHEEWNLCVPQDACTSHTCSRIEKRYQSRISLLYRNVLYVCRFDTTYIQIMWESWREQCKGLAIEPTPIVPGEIASFFLLHVRSLDRLLKWHYLNGCTGEQGRGEDTGVIFRAMCAILKILIA